MDYKKFMDELEKFYAKAEKDFHNTKEHEEFMNIIRSYPQYQEDITSVNDRYNHGEYSEYLQKKANCDLMSYVIAYNIGRSHYFYHRAVNDYPFIIKKLEENEK